MSSSNEALDMMGAVVMMATADDIIFPGVVRENDLLLLWTQQGNRVLAGRIGASNPSVFVDEHEGLVVKGSLYDNGNCAGGVSVMTHDSEGAISMYVTSNTGVLGTSNIVKDIVIQSAKTTILGISVFESNIVIKDPSNNTRYIDLIESCIFGSNAGYFGSNAGEFGSNAGEFGSNAGYFGSNAGEFGSNAGYFGSNAGEFGSNAGYFGSNAGEFGSNAG
jgi:hypothetical protein